MNFALLRNELPAEPAPGEALAVGAFTVRAWSYVPAQRADRWGVFTRHGRALLSEGKCERFTFAGAVGMARGRELEGDTR